MGGTRVDPPAPPNYGGVGWGWYRGCLAGEARQAALPFAGAGLDRPSNYVKEPI